jgi:hypothetical protein
VGAPAGDQTVMAVIGCCRVWLPCMPHKRVHGRETGHPNPGFPFTNPDNTQVYVFPTRQAHPSSPNNLLLLAQVHCKRGPRFMGLDTNSIHPDSQAGTVDMCAKGASGRPHLWISCRCREDLFLEGRSRAPSVACAAFGGGAGGHTRRTRTSGQDASRGFAPDRLPFGAPHDRVVRVGRK